jgi:hypothetical protein
MRNTLAGLAALLILFSVLGACRSWYTVSGLEAEPGEGKFAFRVEVNAWKVGSDVTDALRWVHSKVSKPEEASSEEPKGKDGKETKDAKEAKETKAEK